MKVLFKLRWGLVIRAAGAPRVRRRPDEIPAHLGSPRALLQGYPVDLMVAYPVGKRVNSPRNNDAGLIKPLNP